MKTEKKKFKRSVVAYICYAIAAIILLYTFYNAGKDLNILLAYNSQLAEKLSIGQFIVLIVPRMIGPLREFAIFFMFGYILDAIGKNNPANFVTEEEAAEAREAKKEARDARKFAKGEAAAAKAGVEKAEKEEAVEADFAETTEKE